MMQSNTEIIRRQKDSCNSPSVVASSTSTITLYVSPSTSSARHNSPLTLSSSSAFINNHDDISEARNRRRSLIHERRNNVDSPKTPGDSNNSNILNRLTSAQQHEHHTDCIKLYTENKINAKNAFALHLIDYMALLLKRKQLENFQVASSTLDASAKIYAGRVDAVHTDTYKLMVGLGSKPNEAEEEVDDNFNENEHSGKNKKKRRRTGKSMIAPLKKITMAHSDMQHDVDPLFHIMSAAFDDGGTSGLLMNHRCCLDDTSDLVFDADTVVFEGEEAPHPHNTGVVEISRLKDMFRNVDFDSKEICPSFHNFKFTESDEDERTTLEGELSANMHCFDVDAAPEMMRHEDDDCHDEFLPHGDVSLSVPPDTTDVMQVANSTGNSTQIVGQSSHSAQSSICFIRDGTVNDLIPALADLQTDYSYFNKRFMQSWAGPSHWSLSTSSTSNFHTADENSKAKPTRKKKAPLRLQFCDESDKVFSVFVKVKKRATVSKATLAKYTSKPRLLPEDLHYTTVNLTNLFLRPHITLKKRAERVGGSFSGNIDNYDYTNEHDVANFCPVANDVDEFDADADLFNLTDGDGSSSNFGLSQDMSQITSQLTNLSLMDGSMLAGDNLVSQPHKVANIEINYAKTAKRVDVKRLKSAIWNILTDTDTQCPQTPVPNNSSNTNMASVHTFQDLLSSLPDKLSKQSANNLSVPIAFVCLLHVANEKVLSVTGMDAMSNLNIGQDRTQT